ncbi:hypothetical protein G7Z17_g8782 [Cylindrodendrum hubeiense]|uniref:Uncharacterized protein n=1 Tax=Cylindrodendrum hubeiense TaxID=595255 RepID=A0A9P5H7Y3_9HYPO|nr:hypothetical protein G7Z17_g8782 [Cylindrodendrum hubeiense]
MTVAKPSASQGPAAWRNRPVANKLDERHASAPGERGRDDFPMIASDMRGPAAILGGLEPSLGGRGSDRLRPALQTAGIPDTFIWHSRVAWGRSPSKRRGDTEDAKACGRRVARWRCAWGLGSLPSVEH